MCRVENKAVVVSDVVKDDVEGFVVVVRNVEERCWVVLLLKRRVDEGIVGTFNRVTCLITVLLRVFPFWEFQCLNHFFKHRSLDILNSLMDIQCLAVHQTLQNVQKSVFKDAFGSHYSKFKTFFLIHVGYRLPVQLLLIFLRCSEGYRSVATFR
jgi:hypothetical protein